MSGTSFATPVVTGVAALLLSLQRQRGEAIAPQKIRTALLETALPCNLLPNQDSSRCLVGQLNRPLVKVTLWRMMGTDHRRYVLRDRYAKS